MKLSLFLIALFFVVNAINGISMKSDNEPTTELPVQGGGIGGSLVESFGLDSSTQSNYSDIESSGASNGLKRSKRALTNLARMMMRGLGCDPMDYNGYGCYCGSGGSGEPIDGIDTCCKNHDDCYRSSGCGESAWNEYTTGFSWTYENHIICSPGETSTCSKGLCNCDKTFVECLARQDNRCPAWKRPCPSKLSRLGQNILGNLWDSPPMRLTKWIFG